MGYFAVVGAPLLDDNTSVEAESDSKIKYRVLENDQRVMVDSINNLAGFSAILQQLKLENSVVARENSVLKQENTLLKQQTRGRNRSREYEYER